MFDVIWTDPNRELVGEHRAKKEKKRDQKEKQKEKQKTLASRSSLSTRSSHSSDESPFGFLRSRGLKRVDTGKANSNPKSGASSGLLTPSILSSRSPLSVASDGRSYRHSVAILENSDLYSERTRGLDRRGPSESTQDGGERSVSSSSQLEKDITNRATDQISEEPEVSTPMQVRYSEDKVNLTVSQEEIKDVEPTKLSRLVQTLGPSSYITKRTEVSWLPRDSQSAETDLTTKVSISSDPHPGRLVTPPTSPEPGSRPNTRELDSPINFFPGARSPARDTSTAWITAFKPNNPDAWRPPHEWDCQQAEIPRIITTEKPMKQDVPDNLEEGTTEDTLDLSTLQKEVKRMAVTSAEATLARLYQIWDSSSDPSQHQELEMEKKRWMLSALHHLDPVSKSDVPWPSKAELSSTSERKVLALYESKVTTSYLAALHLTKQIYHISSAPLSHALFPNVHPVLVPSVSPAMFPVAQQLFETVYSISLPSVCPSQDIPGVLKNIHKCLRPKGSLQLTLIDPLPCADTLGHRMRAWLEENLLLNLEKNFRCVNPSRIFPHWLGEASLRGQGSTLTTAKFYAIPASARSAEADPDPFIDRVRTEKEVKAELRSLVGRMLWMEVWGGYVTGGRWWWDDAGCVEECLQLGTFWEYNVIKGIKGEGR